MSKNRDLTPREHEVLNRLAKVLQDAKLSWGDAAEVAGRSKELGHQWSSRRSFPREEALYRLAAHLGIAMGWLLTGDEPSAEVLAMTEREKRILKAVRDLPPETQDVAIAQTEALKALITKK